MTRVFRSFGRPCFASGRSFRGRAGSDYELKGAYAEAPEGLARSRRASWKHGRSSADIDAAAGAAAEEEITAGGGREIFVQTDITVEESVAQTVACARGDFGAINVLFNSAGGSLQEDDIVTDVDMAVWDRAMDLDLKGTFLCCRHVIPGMVAVGIKRHRSIPSDTVAKQFCRRTRMDASALAAF